MPTDDEIKSAQVQANIDLLAHAQYGSGVSLTPRELAAVLGTTPSRLFGYEKSWEPIPYEWRKRLERIAERREIPEPPVFTHRQPKLFAEGSSFVQNAREKLGMSRKQLAAFIECDTPHIAAIEEMKYTLTGYWRENIQALLDSPPEEDDGDEAWGARHNRKHAVTKTERTRVSKNELLSEADFK